MCDYQRSSEHVVTRRGSTGSSTVTNLCTIDVRTHGTHGVPTGPLEPHRDPTGPQRTACGVGPQFLPGLGGPQLLLAQPRLLDTLSSSLRDLVDSSKLVASVKHSW